MFSCTKISYRVDGKKVTFLFVEEQINYMINDLMTYERNSRY